MLKTRSAGTQLLIVISIALASFFLVGMLGTVILSLITDISLTKMVDTDNWNYTDPSTITMLRGMQLVQFISLFLIPALICSWLFGTSRTQYLWLKKFNMAFLLAGIVAMIAAIPFVNWIGEWNRQIQFPPGIEAWMREKEDQATQMIKTLLLQRSAGDLLLNLFFISVLASVGEELLFRGILQRIFIKLFKSPLAGIIVAALLFSAMHMQFYGFIPRFLLGVLLGLIYWYSGSLWVAIIAHFVYDATLIILAFLNPALLNEESPAQFSGVLMIGLTALLILSVVWMKSRSRVTYKDVYAEDSIPVKDHPF